MISRRALTAGAAALSASHAFALTPSQTALFFNRGQAPSILFRNPTNLDDTTRGYVVGSYWYNQTNGTLWKATAVTANAAVWALQAAQSTTICDAIATAPIAVYGFVIMVAAYAGYCCRIQRASDSATLDLGFVQSGPRYVVDAASGDTFCAGTTGTIIRGYDQSGNGNDIVATATNFPAWTTNTVNGLRTIAFGSTTYKSLQFPATISVSRQNYSALFVGRQTSPAQGSTCIFSLGTNATFSNNVFLGSFNTGRFQTVPGTAYGNVESTSSVISLTSSASNEIIACNEDLTGSGAAQAAGTLVGGAIGAPLYTGGPAAYEFWGEMLGFALYNTALSAANTASLRIAAYATAKLGPQLKDRLMPVGDSITAGANANEDDGYSPQTWPLTKRPYQLWNKGASGQTIAFWNTNIATLTGIYKSGVKNVALVFCGTNDINNGTAATTLCAADGSGTLKTLCTSLRTAGFKVLVISMLPRANTSLAGGPNAFEAQRQIFNTNLAANWTSFADAFDDAGNDPIMGVFNAGGLNPTYYYSSLHPTALGATILANRFYSAINTFG